MPGSKVLAVLCGACLQAVLVVAENSSNEELSWLIINGNSMSPSFQPGQRIAMRALVDRADLTYDTLVAVQFNSRKHKMLKRVYAIAGDTIEVKDGELYRNSKKHKPKGWPASYRIPNKKAIALRAQLKRSDGLVPNNKFVVLGDNPNNSFDSLDYGLVERNQIIGTIE